MYLTRWLVYLLHLFDGGVDQFHLDGRA